MDPADAQVSELRRRLTEVERENERRRRVMEIGQALGREMELADLLPLVIAKVTEVLEADRSTLFLYDRESDELWTMVGEGLEINEIRLPADQGIAGRVAQSGRVLNVPDAYELEYFDQSWYRRTGYRTRSVLAVPLNDHRGGLLGVIQVLNRRGRESAFTEEDERFLQALSAQIAVHVENAALRQEIENLFENIVGAISIALDGRDPVTAGHSRRVTQFTLALARAVHGATAGRYAAARFTRAELRELRYAALLHDFGKVGVPEAVLQKAERLPVNWIHIIEQRFGRRRAEALLAALRNGREEEEQAAALAGMEEDLAFLIDLNTSGFLSEEAAERLARLHRQERIDRLEYEYLSIRRGTLTPRERRVMESHVIKTRHVLAAIPWPEDMARVPLIAAAHHESPNGSGYPDGLAGKAIPLGGLLMAVADVYDALTAQDRPYKPAMPHAKAAGILADMARGEKLDAELVELFLALDPPHLLDAGEKASDTAIFRQVEEAVGRNR